MKRSIFLASAAMFAAASEGAASATPGVKNLTIAGVNFDAPFKYSEGHVLTAIEARVLNQTRFENLRNNFAARVKASVEGAEGAIAQADLPAKFAEFEATYDFATPGTGTGARTLDPVEKEALALAKDIVKEKLAGLGKKLTPPADASDEQKAEYKAKIAAAIESVAAKDEVVAIAKKNVAARAKSISSITEGLDL